MQKNIHGKVVLVTGAGGSIGSELCTQILRISPSKLILLELNELALYNILEDLTLLQQKMQRSTTQLIPLLASVKEAEHLRDIMRTWKPETIYHAAAYKHVPLVEHNPVAGIQNNVFGTLNVAQVAIEYGVCDVVLISTDKAVRPTNVMGATKRLAEMIFQALAEESCKRGSTTKLCMVRFGNVLGSSGSVVPKFRQQIDSGGPISITHSEVTRYFMTIPEAAQLVIQAAAMPQSQTDCAEVFVLDMGEPVKIVDLARSMIELSGLTMREAKHPEGDIALEITGLRPGEKLYEELLIGEFSQKTAHPKINRASEHFTSWTRLSPQLEKLRELSIENSLTEIQNRLREYVIEYQPETV